MKKFLAFTLAEIMLAMSIVGVIAAMTIPTLNYRRVKQEYSAKLKMFYGRIENAIMDMTSEKGSFRNMSFDPGTKYSDYNWFITNIDPYVGHQSVDQDNQAIYLADGSSIHIKSPSEGEIIHVIYDVNGDKAPNSYGRDQYVFVFAFTKGKRIEYFGNPNTFFGTNSIELWVDGTSRKQLVDSCFKFPDTCSYLLQTDQWEYASDYPIKF